MTEFIEVRRGAYHDSVTLMQVSRDVAAVDGVTAAQVAMGTELNLDLLRGMGFAPPPAAGPNDLVVAVRADDDDAVARAVAAMELALAGGIGQQRAASPATSPPPRTVASAARRTGGADLALVSVPGPHAFTEAMDALGAGLSVLVFSDNVPVEQEVRLKDEAARPRPAGDGTGLRHRGRRPASGSASPTRSGPARSASWPPAAPVRSS